MLGPLIAADEVLFLFINQGLANPVLDFLMPQISHLGSVYLWAPLSIFALHYRRLLGKRMIAGLVSVTVLVIALKQLIARPRPFEVLQGVRMLDIEAFAGYPSGHTTIAFFLAVLFSKEFPKYRPLFYVLAVLVAFSRVYVGMHYPLDVFAGAVIGIAAGYATLKFIPKKLKKPRKRRKVRR